MRAATGRPGERGEASLKYTATNFAKAVKGGPLGGLIYFFGDQRYLMERFTAQLLEALGAGEEQVVRLDGDELDFDALGDEVVTVSFTPPKVLVISGLSPEGMSEAQIKRLGEMADYLSLETVLIAQEKFVKESYKVKRAKAQKLRKLADAKGALVDVNKPDASSCAKLAAALAREEGIAIAERDVAYLVEHCGGDLLKVQNELKKLGSYRLGETVRREDIDRFTAPTVERTSFEMARALIRGDVRRALHLLGDLLDAREEPITIVAALATNFCDMYKVKCGQADRLATPQIEKTFGYRPGDFRVKQAVQNSRSLKYGQVVKIVEELLEADLALKSSGADATVILQRLLVQISLLLRAR